MTYEQRLRAERWLAWVRVGAVPFAAFQAAITTGYPSGHEAWTWVTTGVLAVGAAVIWWLAQRDLPPRALARLGFGALAFDFLIVSSFVLALTFVRATPIRQVLILVLIEAAFRYGLVGGLGFVVANVPTLIAYEWLRADYFHERYHYENITLQIGVEVMIALIVGWLIERLRGETSAAIERAHEAEHFRDELGRRADLLDAANRCARSLGSSLEIEEAFGAFIRELRGLIPFDRTAIILSEQGHIRVMATAGHKHDEVLRPGEALPPGALIETVMSTGETVYRRDMSDHKYPEEVTLTEIGLHSRIAAPLLLGVRPIGMLAILRREPEAFGPDEIELATLLGRLVATGVQNIRAYSAERETVEELRRLSALRADFVSLVSHELRSPMAAVIGAARTLQQRWRELSPEQRASFLALISDETARLATLIGDVLDTSRIEAGTFTYSFTRRRSRRPRPRDRRGDGPRPGRGLGRRTGAGHGPRGARGPRAPEAGADESGRERGQVLTGRRRGGRPRVGRKRARAGRGRGPGAGHSARAAGPDLREVRPRERRRRQAGVGPRALHRALDRGGARRVAEGAVGARPGLDLHAGAAARGLGSDLRVSLTPRQAPAGG